MDFDDSGNGSDKDDNKNLRMPADDFFSQAMEGRSRSVALSFEDKNSIPGEANYDRDDKPQVEIEQSGKNRSMDDFDDFQQMERQQTKTVVGNDNQPSSERSRGRAQYKRGKKKKPQNFDIDVSEKKNTIDISKLRSAPVLDEQPAQIPAHSKIIEEVLEEDSLPVMHYDLQPKHYLFQKDDSKHQLKVGKQFVNYMEHDETFYMFKAAEPILGPSCIYCEKNLIDDQLETSRHCDFCGHLACKNHCHNKRKIGINLKQDKHQIGFACKLCDRKFIQRQLLIDELYEVEDKISKQDAISKHSKDSIQQHTFELDNLKLKLKDESRNVDNRERQIKKDKHTMLKEMKDKEELMKTFDEGMTYLAASVEDENMDFKMDQMSINSLKKQIEDVDEQIKSELDADQMVKFKVEYEKHLAALKEEAKEDEVIEFDEEELSARLWKLGPRERFNLITYELKLGNNPKQKEDLADFQNEIEVMQSFDPKRLSVLTKEQVEFVKDHLVTKGMPEIVDEYMDNSMRSNSMAGSIVSSRSRASTLGGGSLHIKGFGDFIPFQPSKNINGTLEQSAMSKASQSLVQSGISDDVMSASTNSQGNSSRDSDGNLLTEDQRKSRIKNKMQKKRDERNKKKQLLRDKNSKGGIANPDQQCCHDAKDECIIF